MNHLRIMRRMVSALTAVFFIFTNHLQVPAYALVPDASSGQVKSGAPGLPSFSVPDELGRVEEIFDAGKNGFVVLIQDAHSIPDAQKNIRGLIGLLRERDGFHTVALEGSSHDLDPLIFRSFPAKKILEKTFGESLAAGEVSGPIAAAVFDAGGARYTGIEDWPLYEQGWHLFLAAMREGEKTGPLIEEMGKKLSERKKTVYSPALARVDAAAGDFRRNPDGLADFLRVLAAVKEPPKGSQAAVLLEEIRRTEPDESLTGPQIEALIERLKLKLAYSDLAGLNAKFQDYKTSLVSKGAMALFVLELAGHCGLEDRVSPALKRLAEREKMIRSIEGGKFFEELAGYAGQIKEGLFRNDGERLLDGQTRLLELLDKLNRLELSYAEWGELEAFRKKMNGPTPPSPDELFASYSSLLASSLQTHLAFYGNAAKRDGAFFTHLAGLLKKESGDKPGPGRIILVAGGFHTGGLKQQFREKGISYALVAPRIRAFPQAGLYRHHMQGEVSWKNYLEIKNGRTNVYSAFVRSVRDRLMKEAGAAGQAGLAVEWRNKILRELSQQGRIAQASRYTVYVDEYLRSVLPADGNKTVPDNWLARFDRFVNGLRELEAAGQISRPAILKLLEPSTLLAPYDGSLLLSPNDDIDVSVRPRTRLTPGLGTLRSAAISAGRRISSPAQAPARSELRIEQAIGPKRIAFVGDNVDESVINLLGPAGHSLQFVVRVQPDVPNQIRNPDEILAQYPVMRAQGRLSATNYLEPGAEGRDPNRIAAEGENKRKLFERLLEQSDVLFLSADIHEGKTYRDYEQYFLETAEYVGRALKALREKERAAGKTEKDFSHKVIVLKGWFAVDSSQEIFDRIKWFRAPSPEEGNDDLFFDVVFQPDFSYASALGRVEKQIVFGIRNYQDDGVDVRYQERAKRTESLLRSVYALGKIPQGVELDFMHIRSAEQAKDALLLYIAGKLAHFNNLAALSQRFGADLSVIAYGAGLDKRIRRLFTSPSLGFGGQLAQLLDWIREERVTLALRDLKNETAASIEGKIARALSGLKEGKTIEEVLKGVPPELHFLIWLENIRLINEKNQDQFFENIVWEFQERLKLGPLGRQKVTLIGVGYKDGDSRVTKSPAKELIRQLVIKGVREFYIVDPNAREAFMRWVEEIREPKKYRKPDDPHSELFKNVKFHGMEKGDPDLDFYEAVKAGDLTIIVTESHPQIRQLDIARLAKSLAGKPLFDAINLFGLDAKGRQVPNYTFDAMRTNEINYISVGRPRIRTARYLDSRDRYHLVDSFVLGYWDEHQQPVNNDMRIKEFEDYLYSLQASPERRQGMSLLENAGGTEEKTRRVLALVKKQVAVIGGGYVGLVTGNLLADLGHHVSIVDIPQKQGVMDALQSDATRVPIHEPGLRELIIKNKAAGAVSFGTDFEKAVGPASIVYLAVGTPQQENGQMDARYAYEAAEQIGRIIRRQKDDGHEFFKVIAIKSTVTPDLYEGIVRRLREKFGLEVGADFGLVSNPEFLREGSAMIDVTQPDRTVLGIFSAVSPVQRERIEREILELWYPLMLRAPHVVLVTDTGTSSLVKYAANSLLAFSITTSNILAENTKLVVADYDQVKRPLLRDPRVGRHAFLHCGPGYGGSCFPKDVRALNSLSQDQLKRSLETIVAADAFNIYYQALPVSNLIRKIAAPDSPQDLRDRTIAMWGIAFKPDTDDVRETPAAHILYELLNANARQVRIDDPIFRTPEAPSAASITSNFIGELYKYYKKDYAFLTVYEDFRTSDRLVRDDFQQAYFRYLRYHPGFKKILQESSALNDEEFEQEFGVYLATRNPTNPWDVRTRSSAKTMIEFVGRVLKEHKINGDLLREAFFREVYFPENFLNNGRVVFVNSPQQAVLETQADQRKIERTAGQPLRPAGVPMWGKADALLVVTDWKEYKAQDLSAFGGMIVVDTREIYHELARTAAMRDHGMEFVETGRSSLVFRRSELRQTDQVPVPALVEQTSALLATLLRFPDHADAAARARAAGWTEGLLATGRSSVNELAGATEARLNSMNGAYREAYKSVAASLQKFMATEFGDEKLTLVLDVRRTGGVLTADDYSAPVRELGARLQLILNGRLRGGEGSRLIGLLRDARIPVRQVMRLDRALFASAARQAVIPAVYPGGMIQAVSNPLIFPVDLMADAEIVEPDVKSFAALVQFAVGIAAASGIKDPSRLRTHPGQIQAELLKVLTLLDLYRGGNQIVRVTSAGRAVISLRAIESFLFEYVTQQQVRTSA